VSNALLGRSLLAELLGTMLLVAAVVGSGIMAERLSAGNAGLALLANTAATVAALYALIVVFAEISGAHFNPAVSVAMLLRGELGGGVCVAYVVVQVAGACAGALLAHAMFELPLLQWSDRARSGFGTILSEIVATATLLLVVLGCGWRKFSAAGPVAATIGAAYWFTASTSFANPAITLARSLTDTFAGVRPADVPAFWAAQAIGMLLALLAARILFLRGNSDGKGRSDSTHFTSLQ
jgi:glycerol uptake facilitator-like aquaporin